MLIRTEYLADTAAIFAVHAAAFPDDSEAKLVNMLRDDGTLRFSLVAERDNQIVGHIALSDMQAPARTLGLAPVATHPAHQRQGIAAALITKAVDMARTDGWQALFVLGDPAYYSRFGFDVGRADGFDSPYQGPAFAVLPLAARWDLTNGPARYAPAFDKL